MYKSRIYRVKYQNSYFRYKCEKVILSSWGRLRSSEGRVHFLTRVSNTIFLYDSLRLGDKLHPSGNHLLRHLYRTLFFLTECVKVAFCLFCRREVAVSHTVYVKVNWSTHARLSRTPCVKQLLCARKTNTKRRVSHTPFKNIYFWYKCEPSLRSGANVRTSIKSLFHSCIEHYFLTRRVRSLI